MWAAELPYEAVQHILFRGIQRYPGVQLKKTQRLCWSAPQLREDDEAGLQRSMQTLDLRRRDHTMMKADLPHRYTWSGGRNLKNPHYDLSKVDCFGH